MYSLHLLYYYIQPNPIQYIKLPTQPTPIQYIESTPITPTHNLFVNTAYPYFIEPLPLRRTYSIISQNLHLLYYYVGPTSLINNPPYSSIMQSPPPFVIWWSLEPTSIYFTQNLYLLSSIITQNLPAFIIAYLFYVQPTLSPLLLLKTSPPTVITQKLSPSLLCRTTPINYYVEPISIYYFVDLNSYLELPQYIICRTFPIMQNLPPPIFTYKLTSNIHPSIYVEPP